MRTKLYTAEPRTLVSKKDTRNRFLANPQWHWANYSQRYHPA